ncbi:MAG: hypothetical protein KAR83_05295, partial [Thermodesulfovibrionales bacterium]|nr:hypothetical protein [Thermodesulfovibrionales bacterium]
MLYSTDKKHALIFAYAVIGCLLVFVVTSKARIRDSVSDPYGSIITAHAILKHHTMKLNAFESEIKMSHHGIVKLGENIYDEYPPGTAFMSLPAVYIADLLGRDLLSTGGITKTQVNIISIVNPAIFLIIFLIGTFYVPPTESFIVTAVSFFGSSLSSSLSTALWN